MDASIMPLHQAFASHPKVIFLKKKSDHVTKEIQIEVLK
jgi:hypothetical protein